MESWSHHFMANRGGKYRSRDRLYFLGSKITVLPLLQKFLSPHQISQAGDPAKGLRTHRKFDFKDQWDFNSELP